MPKPLAEQVIVITGASSGVGRCTAQHLAAKGARVLVTARRGDALEELVREIEQQGGQAVAVPGDVTRQEDLRAVAAAALEHFGWINTWINNASIYIQGRVQDITLDEYRRILDVNLVGTINGTQCALEVMLRQGAGTIIQVSSVMGKHGAPYASPYSAAKAGIDGFTQALRAELWGTDIRIATLYPPTVDTPIYQHARGKFGTIPKPPPPVEDPEKAARVLAELAEHPQNERTFGPFGHFYMGLSRLPQSFADWVLQHAIGFALSDIPDTADNLDRPIPGSKPAVRAGWAEPGGKGVTLRETVQVLPWEALLGAATLGFLSARATRSGPE